MSTDSIGKQDHVLRLNGTCQHIKQRLRRGAILQRKLRCALQTFQQQNEQMTVDEADSLHSLLKSLADDLAEFSKMSCELGSTEGIYEPLVLRANVLQTELYKTGLTLSYLGHQLTALALRSLAASSVECHEPLSVGVCTLAQELGSLETFVPGVGVGDSTTERQFLSYRNTCPSLLFPARRLTLTRILQLAASHRAETASRSFLAALLSASPPPVYAPDTEDTILHGRDRKSTLRRSSSCSLECPRDGTAIESGNSSFEVARELVQYASPPRVLPSRSGKVTSVLDSCITAEQRLPACLLLAARNHAPQLAGPSGASLLAQRDSRSKVLTYYRQLLWGDVGTLSDHMLLWWLKPLGSLWSGESLLRWLRQEQYSMREEARTAVSALCEALATHHAVVTWDALFRRALVSPAGSCFAALLHSLVGQVQWAEMGPAVEQIPLLHRLDHSLHTYRLWVLAATRLEIGAWRVQSFVNISQRDVADTLADIQRLMRAPEECIEVMAAVCRTVSLANLHMCFPERRYWRQDGALPQFASSYVEEYLDQVMRPVLSAVSSRPIESQQKICGMALRIVCEAWLDHIYQLRVQFSEWGALQLLADFGAVPTWLQERANLPSAVERHLVRSEILRRCEGVGRLLLRKPGEALDLTQSSTRHNAQNDSSPATPVKDSMPAEMYVPNQEKWLELRARRRGPGLSTASALLCCR